MTCSVVEVKVGSGQMCGVCWNGFGEGEVAFTHEGRLIDGKRREPHPNHDPFHKECLRRWVVISPVCPFDRVPLDLDSVVSRTARVFNVLDDLGEECVLEVMMGMGVWVSLVAGAGATGFAALGAVGCVVMIGVGVGGGVIYLLNSSREAG